jgi:hypothetical protein
LARNGSGVYSLPAGSLVTNGDTSDATDLNTPLSDIETDMNTPRPVVAGGTGASSASAARTNLGVPAIADVAWEFISTQDASNSAQLDFTGFDSSIYDHYVFVFANIVPATDLATLQLRTSTNGGSSYDSAGGDYLYSTASINIAITPITGSATSLPLTAGIGSDPNEDGASGVIWVHAPHLAKRTIFTVQSSAISAINATPITNTGSGYRDASSDVDAVRFFMSSGNIESGQITMYGVRNA